MAITPDGTRAHVTGGGNRVSVIAFDLESDTDPGTGSPGTGTGCAGTGSLGSLSDS
ncbi:hypothetical protein [Rhodococcus sp. NPDC049939]|uniref:hypothetical protein n=1 Tax=Rhodococcus sp. NPDC049939 TaxID=3155511 RepID=UPI00340212AB